MAVIETVRFRLRAGAAVDEFLRAHDRVEEDFLARQPGFNPGTRVTTLAQDGTWTLMMRWDSAAEADSSIAAFPAAPATAAFRSMLESDSLSVGWEVEVPSSLSPKVDNARRLYLEGIRDGDVRGAVERYTGDRYTQHSTGVRDGVEGFVEFFEPFLKRTPRREITIIRTLVDGRYVFVHVAQDLNNGEARWVTADLFDTDGNDRIIEHWDVIAPLGGTNPSGRTRIDGATEITDQHLTEKNKDTVRRFLAEALAKEPTTDLAEFISSKAFLQHSPELPDGLDALAGMIAAGSGEALHCQRIHRVVGQGHFVVALSHQVRDGLDLAAFEIFRLEQGLIVEHWDAVEPLPSGDALVNSGKF